MDGIEPDTPRWVGREVSRSTTACQVDQTPVSGRISGSNFRFTEGHFNGKRLLAVLRFIITLGLDETLWGSIPFQVSWSLLLVYLQFGSPWWLWGMPLRLQSRAKCHKGQTHLFLYCYLQLDQNMCKHDIENPTFHSVNILLETDPKNKQNMAH